MNEQPASWEVSLGHLSGSAGKVSQPTTWGRRLLTAPPRVRRAGPSRCAKTRCAGTRDLSAVPCTPRLEAQWQRSQVSLLRAYRPSIRGAFVPEASGNVARLTVT